MHLVSNLQCKKKLKLLFVFISQLILVNKVFAQGTITYSCGELNISATAALKCNPISEDDPNDLAECYSLLMASLPGNNQHLELGFPSKKENFHWVQASEYRSGTSDSLTADFYFNTNTNGNSNGLHAVAKDFNITITRYDNIKGGIIEGIFSGTMEAFAASLHKSVKVDVKGSFHTTRTGAFGVECRKLRRTEAAVVSNAKATINTSLVQSIQKIGWIVKNSSDVSPSAANHPSPYRPLFFCSSIFDLIISPDPNSEFGKMIDDSIHYYSNQSNMPAIIRLTQLSSLKSLKIRIGENNPYLKEPFEHDADDKFTLLHIPGISYAYRLTLHDPGASKDFPPNYKTFILIGSWNGADMNAATYSNYPFIHKNPGAYLETLTVQIIAPAAIADKIIQNVNWQGLGAALTK